ncbi:hypothetical protein H3Z83_05095 [Tenacibaculum sp. S7007]|uniref:Uncharacterized protein n=1 Tax=Tenacibaculum pelagium TaxID=2759527 RepID=A0A839AN31_9FLAO|nr:hypothetical protein [Tenacibaculum pelagium]MBA6155896.1 hypothetical protein [Tenacibaculum pelagium]
MNREDLKIIIASDVSERDGIGIFRDDSKKSKEFNTYRKDIPLDIIEYSIECFKKEIPKEYINYI